MREKTATAARSRAARKREHVRAALLAADGPLDPGFNDVRLVHDCAPGLAFDHVDVRTRLVGISLPVPLLINAMTGGAPEAEAINAILALAAREVGAPLALGSQRAALEDPRLVRTYCVCRERNPDGVLIANVGADVSAPDARRAVEMIGAVALQVHFNPAQELSMNEGDRDFRGRLPRLEEIAAAAGVPVIAKEVGLGVSGAAARRLVAAGARAIDVGGAGGTNFVAIEAARGKSRAPAAGLGDWGIPTVASLAEVVAAVGGGVDVVASGGVRSGHDIARALALGACAAGVAAPALRAAVAGGVRAVVALLRRLLDELRAAMLLCGAGDVAALARRPVVVGGRTREWLELRGVDVTALARRPGGEEAG